MAKKSKSRKSSKKRKVPSQQVVAQARPVKESEASASVRGQATARSVRTPQPKAPELTFAQEYSYVYSDLKRVGVIAAAMIVILVVLSFILA
jgi:hypothetical protein